MTTFNSIGIGRTIGAGLNDLHTTDFQISVNSTNGIVNINLPPISDILRERFKNGYTQLIAFLIADISGTASLFKTVINASSGELINGLSSIDLDVNNYSILLTPTSDRNWSLSSGIGGGDSTGIAEVAVTFVNTGANYFARFGAVNVISGSPSDFSITPAPNPTTSDTLFCTKDIIQCYGSYYFQCISQAGGQRVFASLFGGARSAGGAISFPLSINNARMSHQINLGYVQANAPITSTLNWSGTGTLTNNSSKLIINYKK
jgi:hypothetical protein